ncbi:MAG: four helix bundle protein [Bacteroidetes bacterium]|nr:four helix bundle protein [Bacteroidota bacterium]
MRKFIDYEVIGLARGLAVELYRLLRQYPREEQYSLCQQIRRAVISVGANIAEGSGRMTERDFAHFVTQAIGSLCELEYLLLVSQDLDYVDSQTRLPLDHRIQILKGKLFRLRRTLLTAKG